VSEHRVQIWCAGCLMHVPAYGQQTVPKRSVVMSLYSLKIFIPLPKISLEWLKLETSNLVSVLIIASPTLQTTNCPWKGRGYVTWPIKIFSPRKYLWNGL